MSNLGNKLKVLSVNCQGLRDKLKRTDVLNYLRQTGAGIVCIQDTHLTELDTKLTKQIWNNNCYLNGQRTNARGVGILLNNNFEHEVVEINKDQEGNYIQLIIKTSCFKLNVISLYAPNSDKPDFFEKIKQLIKNSPNFDYLIICGDFNLVLDPQKDSKNYKNINNPKSRQHVMELMDNFELLDAYRSIHPDIQRYTWRRKNPVKQARLDYFLVSSCTMDVIGGCNILPSYRSDHSIVELDLTLHKFEIGKGTWKLNTGLLKNPDYLNMINNIIDEEKLKYAIPIYNCDYIIKTDEELTFTIDDDIFLECLYLRI